MAQGSGDDQHDEDAEGSERSGKTINDPLTNTDDETPRKPCGAA